MTMRSQEPIPRVPMCASDRHLDWPYERLASLRAEFARVRDSDFLWPHERTHLEEVIERIDLTVSLKRQREEYRAGKSRRARTT
jgi:hypothetical protein